MVVLSDVSVNELLRIAREDSKCGKAYEHTVALIIKCFQRLGAEL